jgi:hypothetical protein
VLAYLTRYCKDYHRSGQARYRTMTLAAHEFIRRFLLHVLPRGFHRVRHYGLLASAACKANIARAKELIAARSRQQSRRRHMTRQRQTPLRQTTTRRALVAAAI